AFEAPVNGISEPGKGPFGWVIVRVLSVTPGTTKSLEEARKEIQDKITEERAKEKLIEVGDAFEDTMGKGATLEEAAKKRNLPIIKATVDARGNKADGNPVEGLPGDDFLHTVFNAPQGEDSELLQSKDGSYFEFRIDTIARVAKKPFDSVRAQVLDDWKAV